MSRQQFGMTLCSFAFVWTIVAAGGVLAARSPGATSLSPVCSVAAPIAPRITSAVPTAAPGNSHDFYSTLYQTAASIAGSAGVANPLTVSPAQLTTGDNNYYALAAAAYIWGLPLEQFWEKQGGLAKAAAINAMYLSPEIDRSAFIVSPNTDVLYANGFLDLSRNPQAITYPQSETFNVLQIMDAYTNVQGSVGSRVNACGEVVLYWAQASYAAQVKAAYPNNSIAMYSPQAWLIGRVAVDAQAVQAQGGAPQTLYQDGKGNANSPLALWRSQEVLRQYTVRSLTEYINAGTVTQSPATSAPNTSDAFYAYLSQAVQKNGLLVNYSGVSNGSLNATSTVFDQAALFANFAAIGLSANGFDTSLLTSPQKASVAQGYAGARAALALIAGSGAATAATNYWTLDMSLGQYPPSYVGWLKNATVALIGLGANLAADGAYPRATTDSKSAALTGADGNRYELDFQSTLTAPMSAKGFWSVTVYDANSNIYPSAASRHYYTAQVGGVYALGSIQLTAAGRPPSLYFQNAPPDGSALLPYYIPVPPGPFSLQMRIYDPIPGNQSGITTILNPGGSASPRWIPPAIKKVTGTATAVATTRVQPEAAASVVSVSGLASPVSAPDITNPPWFPSLMAFEHSDSGRTKLFAQAQFNGSLAGGNVVNVRTSPDDYPTPYNVVYLGPDSLFLFGGAYGDRGGTGSFVARVDPQTLRTLWFNQLIDTVEANVWNYPGVLSALQDGFLYLIYGPNLAKLDPKDGRVLGRITLPTRAAPRDTSYNGLSGLPDGTLVAKSVYRQAGCELQGFSAFLNCPDSTDVPNSIVVTVDPRTLEIVDQVVAPEFIGGRITATVFEGRSYVYLTGQTTVFRYLYENQRLTLDAGWNPGRVVLPGQTGPTAVAVMNDWVVLETNATPANIPMSVIAINQADASRQFSGQPFASLGVPQSWSPSAVTVDPVRNRIYALDGSVGRIAALEVRRDGLYMLWTAAQRTVEFLALIGPTDGRVLFGTDVPPGQQTGANSQSFVVWRNADTGAEIARSPLLPAVNGGTMVEPGHAGRTYFLAQNGKIIELTPQALSETPVPAVEAKKTPR